MAGFFLVRHHTSIPGPASYLPSLKRTSEGNRYDKILGATIGALVFMGLNIAISSAVNAQQITDCVTC
jgi:hypothetical protein